MKNVNLNVNWEKDPKLKRWLKNKQKGTRENYLSAFRAYTEFTRMTPEQLIAESDEEMNLKPSERGRPERRIESFFNWLQTEYVRKKRGKKKGEVTPSGEREIDPSGKKGVTASMAKSYVGYIRGFYSEFHYETHFERGTFDASPANRRFNWTIEDIRELVEHAKTTRDRAIILCQFQGGMDDSTLCSLNYGHVSKELKTGKIPLMLDIKRKKIEESYITFLSEDAVNALKAYLSERRRKEQYDLGPNDPIFVRESWKRYKKQRIRPKTIQDLFRKLALECEFITEEELKKTHWNPARAHALRSAFQSLLRSAGLNQQDIDFMSGHKIPYQKAYYQQERERLRKTYGEAMHVLAVFTSTSYKVFEDRLNEQGIAIKTLLSERGDMNKKIEELELTINQLKVNIGRRYGEVDRRTAVLLEQILLQIENDPELREYILKNLGEQLREVKVT